MGDFKFKDFLAELRRINLCTWYLLPLTGLTRLSFGDGLFLNSYLERNKRWIIVHVPDLQLVPKRLQSHAVRLWSNENGGYLAYQLDPQWNPDVELFINGQYSSLSEELKAVIFDRSGLPYMEPAGNGRFHTDLRLLMLKGGDVVREYFEQELQTKLDPGMEVLGPPPVTSFMDVHEG